MNGTAQTNNYGTQNEALPTVSRRSHRAYRGYPRSLDLISPLPHPSDREAFGSIVIWGLGGNEAARDIARRKMKTKAFLKSRDQRKRVEMRFAHLKTHHGFERMRLRGLSGARDEFHLAAIVQNLKTMALQLLSPQPEPAPV